MKKLKSILKISKNNFCKKHQSFLSEAFFSEETPNFTYLEGYTKKKKYT